jgi:hypothetical protein
LIAAQLSEAARRACALVERHEELRVELRHLLAQLVGFALRVRHTINLAPRRAGVTSLLRPGRQRALDSLVVPVSPGDLDALLAKYATMLALRVERIPEEEMRRRMAELALRFPGSLRELDDLELREIRRRVEALDAVLGGRAQPEAWMEAVALFHALTRGALAAKRWLGGRKRVDAALARRFAAEHGSLPFAEDARSWADELEGIASPPRGRLTEVVFARVARTLGVGQAQARRLVFGVPRRERRAN